MEASQLTVVRGIGVALLSWATSAGAQSAAPQREISIQAVSRVEYDSNVLRTSRAAAATRGLEADDIRWSPSLDLNILYPVGRNSLYLNGSIGYRFHRNNDQLDRERIDLNGGGVAQLAGCQTSVDLIYSRGLSDLADLVGGPTLTNTEERRSGSVNVSCGGTIGLRPGVGYTRNEVENSAVARQGTNYASDTYTASLAYVRPTFGELSLYGTYLDGRYPNRAAAGPLPVGDGVEIYNFGASYQRQIGARLRGVVSGGYTKVKPRLATTADFSGVSYSGDITWTGERANVMLAFGRSAEQSNLIAITYAITTRFSIDTEYAFNERMRAEVGAYQVKRNFESSLLTPANLVRPDDRTRGAYVGATWSAVRRVSFNLRVLREERETGVALFDYRHTQVALTTRLTL